MSLHLGSNVRCLLSGGVGLTDSFYWQLCVCAMHLPTCDPPTLSQIISIIIIIIFMFARVCAAATPNRLIMCSLHQMTQTLDSGGERADVLMESMHAMKARVVGAGGSTGIACLKNTYVVPRWLL